MGASDDSAGLSQDGLAGEFQRHSNRLRRMIELRLDPRLKGRINPSDVLQETWLEAARRLSDYSKYDGGSPFLWLRFLTGQKLLELHRRHFQVQARALGRELPLARLGSPAAQSSSMACELIDKWTPPEMAAQRNELLERLEAALDGLDPLDREILVLRHFEQLTAVETGGLVGLPEWTCRRRYLAALRLLRRIIEDGPIEP